MELLMGGVGDAFSTRHWGTHFIVRKEGFHLLVDCPDSFRRALKANAFVLGDHHVTLADIDAVFITHLHGDHVNGLEMLLAFRAMVLQKQTEIYTTPQVAEVLWERRLQVSLGQFWDGEKFAKNRLTDFADIHEVAWGKPAKIGPFELTTRKTTHHLPAAAMRIESADATLAHSCDTAWDPELVEWLFDGSDAVLHETSHGPAHTPIERLAELSDERRSRMWVVHYPDDIDPDAHPGLRFAIEGSIWRIGSS